MSDKHIKIVIVGAILVVIGLLTMGFFLTHERKKRTVRVPPSGEARKNPFLAFERLLSRHDIPTETTTTRAKPDGSKQLIFLADDEVSLTPEQRESWQEWIRAGGHLAITTPPENQSTSPLLESLGFTYSEPDDEGTVDHPEAERHTYWGPDAEPVTFTRRISWTSRSVDWLAEGRFEESDPLVTFDANAENSIPEGGEEDEESGDDGGNEDETETAGEDDTGEAASDGDGGTTTERRVVAVSKPVGDGRATLIQSMAMFRNTAIDNGERATIGVDIASLTDSEIEQTRGLIVRFANQRSWTWYVLGAAWPMFAAGAILVLLALWQGRYRFGPLVPPPPGDRRSRAEHIRAMGEFLWDRDVAAALLEATRESLLEELERRHPSLKHINGPERRRRVRVILELEDWEVEQIFEIPQPLSPDQFETRIRLMEDCRRNL